MDFRHHQAVQEIGPKIQKHARREIDKDMPAWMRPFGDYNLALLYPQEEINMRPKERWGFDYVYGSTTDRVLVGTADSETTGICSEDCAYPTHPFYIEDVDEVVDPTAFAHDKRSRPMWHLRQFEHLRPWHVNGEQISRHFDRHHHLLATNAAYLTENDVLDAIRNDEFVERP